MPEKFTHQDTLNVAILLHRSTIHTPKVPVYGGLNFLAKILNSTIKIGKKDFYRKTAT